MMNRWRLPERAGLHTGFSLFVLLLVHLTKIQSEFLTKSLGLGPYLLDPPAIVLTGTARGMLSLR